MYIFRANVCSKRSQGFIDRRSHGFTVVELIIVITVIVILASISYSGLDATLPLSRDSNRSLDISTISDRLEIYYETTPVAGGYTYPATSVGTTGLASIIDSQESIMAPGQSSSSLVIATSNSTQSPTTNQYIYQPLTRTGARCTNTSSALCARYILYYRKESPNSVIMVNSLRQQ